jgi:phage shock protein PspC (stress-responsive transcriptional regulator)
MTSRLNGMTTMSDSGSPNYAGPPPFSGQPPFPAPPRALRRSRTDRVISGVSGGLGEYFGVDPVIFRVLFAVLSFFGGIGLLAYGLAWILIPEPEVNRSVLDKALHQLRVRRVPPWLVIIGGVAVLWLGWFSWWAPHTIWVLILIAVVALVLARRLRNQPPPGPWGGPTTQGWTPPGPWGAPPPDSPPAGPGWTAPADAGTPADTDSLSAAESTATEDPTTGQPVENTAVLPSESVMPDGPSEPVEGHPTAPLWAAPTDPAGPGLAWQPPPAARQQATAPLIPPLNDTRRSMQAWLAEAGEAHRIRVQRRRPIKLAVLLALAVGWGLVALFDAAFRVPFPAYLWVGLSVLGLGLLVSIATRRTTLSLLIPIVFLAAVAVVFGGTRASLSDGSGRIGWLPASSSQLGTYRQFAGQSTLDLTQLAPLGAPASVTISQAAGEVVIRVPATLNATVIADVHMGDIRNGQSTAAGQFQAGLNVHLQLNPPAAATGEPLTVHVSLTAGHVQVDRVG